jgi:hypothetical protein
MMMTLLSCLLPATAEQQQQQQQLQQQQQEHQQQQCAIVSWQSSHEMSPLLKTIFELIMHAYVRKGCNSIRQTHLTKTLDAAVAYEPRGSSRRPLEKSQKLRQTAAFYSARSQLAASWSNFVEQDDCIPRTDAVRKAAHIFNNLQLNRVVCESQTSAQRISKASKLVVCCCVATPLVTTPAARKFTIKAYPILFLGRRLSAFGC